MNLKQRLKGALPRAFKRAVLEYRHRDESGLYNALLSLDQDMRTIFDVGANVGDVSLAFLRWFPKAQVYAFEPGEPMFKRLCADVEAAGFTDRFHPHRLGFFDKTTEADLHLASHDGASSMLEIGDAYHCANPHIETTATERISLVRMDDFVREARIEKIDLVKIDVEGVETEVLLGGSETFRERVDTVILEISFVRHERSEGAYIRLFETMHSLGFAPSMLFDIEQGSVDPKWKLAQVDCIFRKF